MITSVQNNLVKKMKKLHMAKERKKQSQFLLEGTHLVETAVASGWPIEMLLVSDDYALTGDLASLPYEVISDNVLEHLSVTKTPQGIIALANMKEMDFPRESTRVLVCDGVQDPGNLGTIIRTADAAGFDAVIYGKGSADLYNDKTVRSTQGSLFHIPVIQADLLEKLPELKSAGFHVWGAALQESVIYNEAEKTEKLAIIVGNEGAGIREEILEMADTIVKIPIYGQAESLNVAIAAGILMYEAKK
ncbi:RNA methyltransferase [Aciduricibacillus chroicocephali]|uniref:RNA methyltransferase n=1 Tax=Aciduricibacillus chroicocephali TaxID=3054939 RepID=A0ABY9KYU7_9BACI|nr:RNA methyltransferase [Bacillaceae bacterium 44XB]